MKLRKNIKTTIHEYLNESKYLNKKTPKNGDYICVYVDDSFALTHAINFTKITKNDIKNFYDFINNEIGIVGYYNDHFNPNKCEVEIIYSNVPEDLKCFFTKSEITSEYSIIFSTKYIVAFGKTKKEVKFKLKVNKYNL